MKTNDSYEKTWGRRVARLAKEADVPWEIAKIVGDIESDEDALMVLKSIKTHEASEDNTNLLFHDMSYKQQGIGEVIGWEAYSKIKDILRNNHHFTIAITKYLLKPFFARFH